MRVFVTRPEPDGLRLKGLLETRGHEADVEPLMQTTFLGFDPAELDGVTAVIATSRNALRAIKGTVNSEALRGITIYAVGAATAEEARRMGFGTVIKGPGTAAALIPVIASTLDPTEEMLLHLRGDKLAVDVRGELEALGFRLAEAIVYRMQAAQSLSTKIREWLSDGEIDAVMLMSTQSAAIYARLMVRHRLEIPARQIVHLCLSDAVADRLAPLGDVPIEVAEEPTLEEMLALVDLAAAKLDL